MAVTFSEVPYAYTPSGNPLRFVFSSNQTAQDNFSYKVEVYVNAVLVETHKIFPTVGTYGYFDATDTAERWCTPCKLSTGNVNDAENYKDIKVKVIENYGTPPIDHASNENTFTFHKGKLSKLDFLAIDLNKVGFANGSLWMTTYPSGEDRFIDFGSNNLFASATNSLALKLVVNLKDINGVILDTQESTLSVRDKVSTVNINDTHLTSLGFSGLVISQFVYCEFWWQDGAGKQTQHITVRRDDRCTRGVTSELVFLNSFGGLETYRFINNTAFNSSVKSIDYERNFGELDEDGTFSYENGGLTSKVKMIDNSMEVQTDWLNELEQKWLVEQLSASSLVYYKIGSDYVPVRVSRSSYKVKTNEVDMVYQEKFKIDINKDTSTVL